MGRKRKSKDFETLQARFVAHYGVRNTTLEKLHCGMSPSSKIGDYSDVKVVSPFGEIPWTEVSRISDKEMRLLMLDIEKQIKKAIKVFELSKNSVEKIEDFQEYMTEILFTIGVSWDEDRKELQRRLEKIKPLKFDETDKEIIK